MSKKDSWQPQSPPLAKDAAATATHPVRWLLATLLAERPLSAAELAAETDMAADKVRRHLRTLRAAGVIEVVEERRRRNTAEQVYATVGAFVLTEEDLSQMDFDTRRRVYGYILKIALREATRSLVTEATPRGLERLDACIVRVPMAVDEQGWTELAQLHDETFQRVLQLRERVRVRVAEGDAEPIPVSSVQLCFEVPPTP